MAAKVAAPKVAANVAVPKVAAKVAVPKGAVKVAAKVVASLAIKVAGKTARLGFKTRILPNL